MYLCALMNVVMCAYECSYAANFYTFLNEMDPYYLWHNEWVLATLEAAKKAEEKVCTI